jgi:hypothetical protein
MRNRSVSAYAECTLARLREQLRVAVRNRPWDARSRERIT